MNDLSQLTVGFCVVSLLTIICIILFDIKKILKDRIVTEVKGILEKKEKNIFKENEKPYLTKFDNYSNNIIEILENIQKNLELSLHPKTSEESSRSLVENSVRNLKHTINLLKFSIKMEGINVDKKVS